MPHDGLRAALARHGAPLAGGAAIVALALATRGRTAVPAPPLAAAAAIALAGVALVVRRRARAWSGLAAAAAGLAAATLHLRPGVVSGHSTYDHLWGSWAWLRAWKGGDPWPLWLHHLGPGEPLPMFYGPLPFWAGAPVGLVTDSAAAMLRASLVLAAVVAALAAWRVVLGWTRDPRAALVAGVAWAFAPFRLLAQNYTLDLGEAWALALAPLVLGSFLGLLRRGGARRHLRAAAAVALLVLAHPLSLATLLPPLLALWLAVTAPWRAGRAALAAATRCAAAGLLGLALAGVFVLPLLAELGHLDLGASLRDGGGARLYPQHGVEAAQVLRRQLWHAVRWSYTEAEERRLPPEWQEMPFYVGLPLVAAALVGLVVGRRRGPLRPLAVAAAVGALLAWAPVARLSPELWLLDVLQFPWRRLGVASAAAALALGLLAASAGGGPRRRAAVAFAIAALAILDGRPYTGAASRYLPWEGVALVDQRARSFAPAVVAPPRPARVAGLLLPPYAAPSPEEAELTLVARAYREYRTPVVARTIRDERWRRLAVDAVRTGTTRIERPEPWPYARRAGGPGEPPAALEHRRGGGRIEVRTGGVAGRVEVAEQWFPGWQVRERGAWREASANADGLLTAIAAPGEAVVRFRFHRARWDRALGWLSSALAAAACLALAARRRRAPWNGLLRAPAGGRA